MGIISWEKPKKVNTTEEHNQKYSSDSGIAGTYASNMSNEDKKKWKGKMVINCPMPRVELRKTFMEYRGCYAQVLIIVSYKDPNILISTNGKIVMPYSGWNEFNLVIQEAMNELSIQLEIKENGKESN